MAHRNFIKNSIAALLPIALGLGVLLGVNKKPVEQVDGYNAASLPTTIDLRDTTADNIRSYYSALTSLDDSEKQGQNLLKNLKTILKKNQKYFSYENGENVWKMYEITDRDWAKSPATSISGYNDSTKKITGYTYNTSDPYIHALYINRNVENQTTAWADHQQTQWGINREHVWPKAEGFDTSGAGGARGDPMHLMAGNGYANNIHSNNYYGYVNTSSSYTNCGKKYSNLSGNLSGFSKTLGGSTTVFEPQDSDKGDIARAIFYMVARYNYLSEEDSDGINTNNPNLTLTQSLSDWKSSGYTSTTDNPGKMGILTDLLAWHKADPVDQFEIHRNNLLYTNFTNNRNPFIDFPEWADFIWGTVSYTGSTYHSRSTTPTGYARPDSDTINGYNSGGGGQETISVTGVSLNKNSTSIEAGRDETLVPTVAPSDATNQNVTWSTSDATVATVSSGIVTGVSEGTATITVTTTDGGFQADCTVTVTASSGGQTSSEKVIMSAKGYTNEQVIQTIELTNSTITFDKGTNASNSPKYYTTGSAIRVYGGNTFTVESTKTIVAISLTFASGEGSNAITTNVGNYDDGEWSGSANSVTFTIGGTSGHRRLASVEVTYQEEVVGPQLDSLRLDSSDAQTTFFIGEEFNYDDLVVTAVYDDDSEEIITSGFNVVAPDLTTIGEKEVVVTYEEGSVEKSASYSIEVEYPGSSDTFQMIVSKETSSHYQDGAIYLSGSSTVGTAECDAFTATQTKYGGQYDVPYHYDDMRVYGSHRFSFTPKTGYKINSVYLFVKDTTSATRIGQSGVVNCAKTTDNLKVTLTPTDKTALFSFSNTYLSNIYYIIVNFEQITLSWESPIINVYSGSTLTGANVNAWNVSDGTTTFVYSQLTIKLGGETISIPYTWKAEDDGKTLTASRNGVSTSQSEPVVITQTVNNIYKQSEASSDTVTWTANAASNLGSTIGAVNGTDSGKISTGAFEWDYTRTLVYLGDKKSDYFAFLGDTWIQMGSSGSLESISLSTSSIPGVIKSVTVVAGTAGTHKLTIDVGGTKYINGGDIYTYSSNVTATNPDPSAEGVALTYTGTSSGTISISIASSNTTTAKAFVLRSISVSYEVAGGIQQIANSIDHIPAQRAVVKFAKAFNTAMDETENCTSGLTTAWTACSNAYTAFLSEIAALGSTEEAYAKDLIKYATVQYSDDSGEACIERMLKTYEVCVQKHGQTAFMSELVSLSNKEVSPIIVAFGNKRVTGLIIVVTVIGVGAIGGYFFTKSRKKEEF